MRGMSRWRIGTGTLSFVVPGTDLVEHNGAEQNWEDWESWESGEEPFAEDAADVVRELWGSADAESQYEHRVWWWREDGCDGIACACGRVTLLEALQRLDAPDRGDAVRLHADEMRTLFEHFWAGQALVSGASQSIGDACVSCLTEGVGHVWDVYGQAGALAEEFGEALAAYAYELMVGEPRFDVTRNPTEPGFA